MPKITIKGTTINIPNSGDSPNWSPAIIEAFELITDAINGIAGTYDIAPQVQNIDTNNSSTNIDLNNLEFPPGDVRSAIIYYSVYRLTEDSGIGDDQEVVESGTLEMSYNDANPVTQKWNLVRSGSGDASINFNVTDLGQIRFSTTALTGINHTGIITYRAISTLNE